MQLLAHGFVIQRREIHPHGLGIEAELVQNFVGELRDVPLVRMLFAWAIRFDQFVGDGVGALQHEFFLVAAFQERAAQVVNRFALLVHYIVVFQQVFARFEVLRFHGFLRIFDALADELRFDGHAFRHAKPVHHGFYFLAAENSQKIVFE